ncbi:unnamed protein product [Vitrella brassicaformis CCMP3155]|uniref:C2 domain-containing protein n=3 Tax=Vitrella brassicaformis TaxID=1169539 RepID=A0A0G4EEH8_VITBC|nr:unnamed protein product [Vitrella brassicaformis CCMP3155]|eukprot:CEL93793.1 unnamed protein product [Vitrella brassicaformis CCMP3155]
MDHQEGGQQQDGTQGSDFLESLRLRLATTQRNLQRLSADYPRENESPSEVQATPHNHGSHSRGGGGGGGAPVVNVSDNRIASATSRYLHSAASSDGPSPPPASVASQSAPGRPQYSSLSNRRAVRGGVNHRLANGQGGGYQSFGSPMSLPEDQQPPRDPQSSSGTSGDSPLSRDTFRRPFRAYGQQGRNGDYLLVQQSSLDMAGSMSDDMPGDLKSTDRGFTNTNSHRSGHHHHHHHQQAAPPPPPIPIIPGMDPSPSSSSAAEANLRFSQLRRPSSRLDVTFQNDMANAFMGSSPDASGRSASADHDLDHDHDHDHEPMRVMFRGGRHRGEPPPIDLPPSPLSVPGAARLDPPATTILSERGQSERMRGGGGGGVGKAKQRRGGKPVDNAPGGAGGGVGYAGGAMVANGPVPIPSPLSSTGQAPMPRVFPPPGHGHAHASMYRVTSLPSLAPSPPIHAGIHPAAAAAAAAAAAGAPTPFPLPAAPPPSALSLVPLQPPPSSAGSIHPPPGWPPGSSGNVPQIPGYENVPPKPHPASYVLELYLRTAAKRVWMAVVRVRAELLWEVFVKWKCQARLHRLQQRYERVLAGLRYELRQIESDGAKSEELLIAEWADKRKSHRVSSTGTPVPLHDIERWYSSKLDAQRQQVTHKINVAKMEHIKQLKRLRHEMGVVRLEASLRSYGRHIRGESTLHWRSVAQYDNEIDDAVNSFFQPFNTTGSIGSSSATWPERVGVIEGSKLAIGCEEKLWYGLRLLASSKGHRLADKRHRKDRKFAAASLLRCCLGGVLRRATSRAFDMLQHFTWANRAVLTSLPAPPFLPSQIDPHSNNQIVHSWASSSPSPTQKQQQRSTSPSTTPISLKQAHIRERPTPVPKLSITEVMGMAAVEGPRLGGGRAMPPLGDDSYIEGSESPADIASTAVRPTASESQETEVWLGAGGGGAGGGGGGGRVREAPRDRPRVMQKEVYAYAEPPAERESFLGGQVVDIDNNGVEETRGLPHPHHAPLLPPVDEDDHDHERASLSPPNHPAATPPPHHHHHMTNNKTPSPPAPAHITLQQQWHHHNDDQQQQQQQEAPPSFMSINMTHSARVPRLHSLPSPISAAMSGSGSAVGSPGMRCGSGSGLSVTVTASTRILIEIWGGVAKRPDQFLGECWLPSLRDMRQGDCVGGLLDMPLMQPTLSSVTQRAKRGMGEGGEGVPRVTGNLEVVLDVKDGPRGNPQLHIQLLRAQGLRRPQGPSLSSADGPVGIDPYAEVWLRLTDVKRFFRYYRSKTKHSTNEPYWDETCVLELT